jgi:23S rRNA (pseudouridine1915-N3)-methyltransferase
MKLRLLAMGKTVPGPMEALVDDYSRRLGRYIPFEVECLPELKTGGSLPVEALREKEADLLVKKLTPTDVVWLLDERGKAYRSVEFAAHLQKCMNAGPRHLVLVIGGAYGFSPRMYARAQEKISLSRMTFNHQMVRLFAIEQLYRAFSILKGDPYHNE